ncbi:sulfotransferase [Sulfitobacter sp. D35]|uniref:tetratricopeptide repeat-containing sulfotransferase family protein n=1 Tax=Sulfitobacter sp. D35 TaxID=3083252 RepID=UPI00296E3F6C|nr:sulfotransferase [Sulfitobacter sp. D35]MDW4497290.1 sulfotransferase [Sulfitobacter sp. D35]
MNKQTPPARILLSQAERLRRRGDMAGAAGLYEAVISRFPANTRARSGLAALERDAIESLPQDRLDAVAASFRQGHWDEALRLAERLDTDGGPLHPALIEIMGACHLRLGRPEAAVRVYDRALPAQETAELWSAKGRALRAAGRPNRATAAFGRATALAPDCVAHWLDLAACQLDCGQPDAARRAVARALAIAPEHPAALTLQGRVALASGDADNAQAAFGTAIRLDPENAATLNDLAILARALGRRDEALAHYEAALALHPDSAVLHRNLSEIAAFTGPDDPRIARMEKLLDRTTDPDDRAHLKFALFNALDQLGDHTRAFDHLAEGNALRKARLGYDVTRDAALFAWLKTLRLPRAPMGDPQVTPIFVTGLPRSGTTLTEQILSHGADVRPAGELALVKTAIAPILRTLKENSRSCLSVDEILDLQRILRHRLAEYAGGHATVIDKMPLNFRWIGFLCAALPEARIVVMQRDEMALGWSLYRQCFGGPGNGFAYDLGDIACYQALARDLVAHFQASEAERIVTADFGALIRDPFETALALRRACGIPDPDETLVTTDITRPILTASADQVRRAVDPARDTGWCRYAEQLAPLREALDALVRRGL